MDLMTNNEVSCPMELEVSVPVEDTFRVNSGKAKITKAVIIAAGRGSRLNGYQDGRPKPLLEVGGLPLIERVIRSAKRAGITEFVIVIGYQGEVVKKSVNEQALGVKITWVYNDEWEKQNGVSVLKASDYIKDNFLLFMCDHIFDYRILEKVRIPSQSNHSALLFVDHYLDRVNDLEDATKVYTEHNRLIDLGKELTHFNAIDIGIFICSPAIFDALRESQANGDDSLSGGVRVLAQRGEMGTIDIEDHFWQDVDTVSDVRYAEKLLLQATRSPKDGFIARTVNRPISNLISRWLVKTSLTPNQLSVLNFLFTAFIAWLVAAGKPFHTIVSGVLFQFASIFDGCDGEVAIIRLEDSEKGALLDTIMDYLSYIVFIIGVTIGAYQTTHNPELFYIMGGIILLVIIAVKVGLKSIANNSGSMKDFADIMRKLNYSKNKKWYIKFFTILHPIGRRDLFSFLSLLVMLTGSVLLYYWLMMSAVLLMTMGITLIAYHLITGKETENSPAPHSRLVLTKSIPISEEY